jgi:uncharacterized membrane protein YphA (DoxX/SURF4 family)
MRISRSQIFTLMFRVLFSISLIWDGILKFGLVRGTLLLDILNEGIDKQIPLFQGVLTNVYHLASSLGNGPCAITIGVVEIVLGIAILTGFALSLILPFGIGFFIVVIGFCGQKFGLPFVFGESTDVDSWVVYVTAQAFLLVLFWEKVDILTIPNLVRSSRKKTTFVSMDRQLERVSL